MFSFWEIFMLLDTPLLEYDSERYEELKADKEELTSASVVLSLAGSGCLLQVKWFIIGAICLTGAVVCMLYSYYFSRIIYRMETLKEAKKGT